ncbi:hypothetical protein F0L74_25120 [Chitinophaga agrisoli]|uniref:Uncharacterized protein n=1 Tax=Chitinophaga agrisoli TaxID=2607653 RepID=A0A5B2VLW2_9BACT|nr:hypothetical protein [Chitinophaga agrisoli]KAA2239486.1 hypothetical protein F0L74_25120 [Chitinophaga agrisoli]
MKRNHFACVAALLVTVLFSECQQPPQRGPIPFDRQKAAVHVIKLRDGAVLTSNFIAARTRLSDIVARTGDSLNRILDFPSAESFNRDAFAVLLNQKDAQGIRIYYGAGRDGKVRLVMVPIDSKGNDIETRLLTDDNKTVSIPGISNAVAQDEDAEGMENGQHCPCKISKLNPNGI